MNDEIMTHPHAPRLLGIGGSTRAGSLSLGVLKAALHRAEDAGAQTVLAEVRAADAYLLCSPTYHGTVAGGVKNILDALEFLAADAPPYFGGRVVGLMAVGGGGANVISSLTHATRALHGLAAPTVVTATGVAVDPDTGDIRDAAVRQRLALMVGDVLDLTRRLRRVDAGT